MTSQTRLTKYLQSGRNRIPGWFARSDAQIFGALLQAQNQNTQPGSVVEIGVHHGKSFLPLAISNAGRNCYAIDIFADQARNLDKSGRGDRARFEKNLRRHGIDPQGIIIDTRLSSDLSAQDILSSVGPARFFHIDGGHHLEAILSDLTLAEAVLQDHGIIAVDDVFRPEWPEVTIGVFTYLSAAATRLTPFAIGYNKTYFCRPSQVEPYQVVLLADRFLRMYLSKRYKVNHDEILVFQRYPLPEWKYRLRLFHLLTTHYPGLAYFLWRIAVRRLKG